MATARKRNSPIWTIDAKTFLHVLKTALSVTDALYVFGLQNKGGNYKTLQQRASEEGLGKVYSRLVARGIKYTGARTKKPLKDLLHKNIKTNRAKLKTRLLANKLLENKCYICGLPNVWQDKQLVLILDHVNGDSTDNRITNLRLLCPNCNSQTNTFAGRNAARKRKLSTDEINTRIDQLEDRRALAAKVVGSRPTPGKRKCCHCQQEYQQRNWKQKYCSTTCQTESYRRVKRPGKEQLQRLVWKYPRTRIGKHYGVSSNAIEKWCKHYGITTPPRGYWSKLEAKRIIPPKQELQKLTWEMPNAALCVHYKVADTTIRRWWKKLKIKKPPLGYWNRK